MHWLVFNIPGTARQLLGNLAPDPTLPEGKLNLHEFAYGGTSAVSYFGPVHNPWNPELTPGGSSGPPGAAVAAGMCFASVGTDTGGSVRIPASYCGIGGLKPTHGRVTIRGIIPVSWTFDHAGPMCKTVEDAAIMLNTTAEYDPLDTMTVDVPVADYVRAFRTATLNLRIGLPCKPCFDNLNPRSAGRLRPRWLSWRGSRRRQPT